MNEEFFQRLLKTFRIEAAEHIKTISEELLNYEKTSEPEKKQESINTIFRGAHSLKGAARAVNVVEIEGYCQTLESTIAQIRDGQLTTSFKLIDEIHRGIDTISNFLQEENESAKAIIAKEIDSLITNLQSITSTGTTPSREKNKIKKQEPKSSPPVVEKIRTLPQDVIKEKTAETKIPETKLQDTIRVSTKKLDNLFHKSEEMLSCKLESDDLAGNITMLKLISETNAKLIEQLTETLQKESNSGESEELTKILELIGSGITEQNFRTNLIYRQAYQNNKHLGIMVSNLVDEMKEVLMLPFSYLSDVFPKMVRELARDLNKEIELEIKGGDIEIDRRILEEMKDAMIHLIRNSVDHGIESPEIREAAGKNRTGKIILEVMKESGDKIAISLSDDGAGINFESIRNTAIKKNLFSSADAMTLSEEQLTDLLFHPDFSTSKVITDISGRGVGMSVVKEKVNRLNGSIKISSKKNEGTCFRILLPLTLAKIRAVILRCGKHIFALQTINVDRVMRIKSDLIKTVENRESIIYDSKPIPVCHLSSVLRISSNGKIQGEKSSIIVIRVADNVVAFEVDEILHEQEIIVKKLNKQLEKTKFVNGATVLGDGKVIPVLNTHDLLKNIQTHSVEKTKIEKDEVKKSYKLLIADDSITSRMLIRDILEGAGYNVKLAVDGKEALTELKSNKYDLVVSDVEMPRLNGFQLTEKIRSDNELKKLPVVLLTSLAKKEDREKGIDVGANAYIVKSGFDQTNLLDTIKRLI